MSNPNNPPDRVLDVKTFPSEDQKKITITVESDQRIDVRLLIKALANFIKHTVDENKLTLKDFAITDSDKVTKIK